MTRVISAVVLGCLVVYLIAVAPMLLGVFAIFLAALAAAHEMAGLLGAAESSVPRLPSIIAVFLIVAGAWRGGLEGMTAGLAASFVLAFAWIVIKGEVNGAVVRFSGVSLILLYPIWSMTHIILYLESVAGRSALLFLLLCVWACDSAAYYLGSALGRRKLAPQISPNKTVAGAVGGILGALFAAAILRILNLVTWSIPFTLSAGLFLALLAQVGDLAESMIKRDAGVKDSGNLIPGHGGIMDRIDALLFTVPAFYYILTLTGDLI